MTEPELLAEYVATRSPRAFEQLVRQNAVMVYSAARRQVGDADLAEEVAQAVFILLARKSAEIKGPLAGWLISATYYAARNARKLAARRHYHERRAGQMKPLEIHDPQIEWEDYAPALDEAMARLPKRDRDLVTMRYLRGLSLKEVGAAAGISDEAARKRVERSLLQLRRILSKKAVVPAVAILATHLASRASEAAPAKFVETIITSAACAAPGSPAAVLASKTAQAMAWASARLITAIAAFLLLAGISIGLMVIFPGENPAAPLAPPLSPADQIETHLPGHLQLIRWNAVLSDAGARAILNIAHPLATPSRTYQAMTCNANQLRNLIAHEIDAGSVETAASPVYVALQKQFAGFFEFAYFGNPAQFVASDYTDREELEPVDNDHIQIIPNLGNMSISISQNNTMRKFTAAILGHAKLGPGDALLFLGGFHAGTNPEHFHLIVYETYRTTPSLADNFPIYDAAWWCRNGPGGLRHVADIAQVWKAKIDHKPFVATQLWSEICDVAAPFEKTTIDGKTVRLASINRPAQWPCCWWDRFGKPIAGDDGWLSYRTQNDPKPLEGLYAMIQVVGPAAEAKLSSPTGRDLGELGTDNVFRNIECVKIDDNSKGCDVGVMVGPWIEITRTKVGETKTVNGVRYEISQPFGLELGNIQFGLQRTGIITDEDVVTAVTIDGRELESSGNPREISVTGRNPSPQTINDSNIVFAGLKLPQVRYFRILQRKRQWIHFAGYALEPNPPPPQDVTPDQLHQANTIIQNRERSGATATTTP